jgi:single-strand DNA-binding protein
MAGYNHSVILGNIGIAPELRYTQNQRAVANMTVATNENFTNAAGDKVTHVEWHRVVIWGPLAETCSKFGCSKGSLVQVHGRLRTREWEDDKFTDSSGRPVKRYTTELVAQGVQFLSPRKNGDPTQGSEDRPLEGAGPDVGDGSDEIPY